MDNVNLIRNIGIFDDMAVMTMTTDETQQQSRRRKPAATAQQQQQQQTIYDDVSDEYFKPQKTEEQIDALAIIEKTYDEAEKDLIVFVEKQIDLMNQNMVFHGDETPGFKKLNIALMNYESVISGLLAVHQRTRIAWQNLQEKYDNLEATKYCQIERELTSLEKKVPAKGRVDMLVRERFMEELSALKAKVILAENEYNMMNHLVESWKNYQFILGTLSKNAQAEAMASGVAYRNPKEFGDESIYG